MDYDSLKEDFSRYGNYIVVQDHIIVKGMKMRDPWKKQIKQIAKDFTHLTALTNTHEFTCLHLDLDILKS